MGLVIIVVIIVAVAVITNGEHIGLSVAVDDGGVLLFITECHIRT